MERLPAFHVIEHIVARCTHVPFQCPFDCGSHIASPTMFGSLLGLGQDWSVRNKFVTAIAGLETSPNEPLAKHIAALGKSKMLPIRVNGDCAFKLELSPVRPT
jgi:hypothetical protein